MFHIDTKILEKLRDTINHEQHISIVKKFKYSKDRKSKVKEYYAWDKMCAIMDRLDDTIEYLNNLKLNTGKYKRSAFDFYDFMNNASVVIDCVKELTSIFEVDDSQVKLSSNVFNKLGNDGHGTDEKYFEYLRSLCSVHPIETSRHKRYQENTFECSPYVMWVDSSIWCNEDCDLHAVVYTNKENDWGKRIPIYLSQIFKYVEIRVEFILEIINSIESYHNQTIEKLKNTPIKKEEEFGSYIDYLKNLDNETKERFGDTIYPFDYVIKLFELKVSNIENEEKMELYINAFKYAIGFEHNKLQNMNSEGFDNTGIKYLEKNIETSLYYELNSLSSGSEEQIKYNYNLSKIHYLNDNPGYSDKGYVYMLLKQAEGFLGKYVSFEEARGDFEHYALVQLALYLECLENKCSLNRNIPNELKYRQQLLSDEEFEDILKEDQKENNNQAIIEQLRDIFKKI